MDQLKSFLDRKVDEYNQPLFIASDPIVIPHLFSKKQDIEISGLFAALFAWGNRTTIIRKSRQLMELMEMAPHSFIVHHQEQDLRRFEGFCHRTFNTTDLLYFIHFLKYHYNKYKSLEDAFVADIKDAPTTKETGNTAYKSFPVAAVVKNEDREGAHDFMENALNRFREYFFSLEDVPQRTRKHIASPMKNSSCKRLNMYLRWMVRKDNKGVDFGIWKKISPSQLICPLDLHVIRVAQRFKLLERKQADWEAAVSLTGQLRIFDPLDPVKYDFALFGLGVVEKF